MVDELNLGGDDDGDNSDDCDWSDDIDYDADD